MQLLLCAEQPGRVVRHHAGLHVPGQKGGGVFLAAGHGGAVCHGNAGLFGLRQFRRGQLGAGCVRRSRGLQGHPTQRRGIAGAVCLRGGSGANELVVAMFWAQDFRASMMLRFWDGLRAEIEKTARPVRLVIYPYVNDHLKESEALTSGANCHAAIICNASYADLQFLEDTQLPIPVVLYNRVCNGYCSVNVDDLKMGALAARAFADQGCKTAAVLTSSPVFEGMENRMHGFRLEGEHHGLTILANRYCENSIRGGYEAVSHRLRHEWKQQVPDAVFCGSSAIAHGALRAFCEAGYIGEKLPRLIAVGNGPEEMDAFSIPSLSVVYLPMEDMARECIQLVLGQLDGRIATAESRLLPIEYVPRESCGPLTEDAAQ